jgi:hypothetical protein
VPAGVEAEGETGTLEVGTEGMTGEDVPGVMEGMTGETDAELEEETGALGEGVEEVLYSSYQPGVFIERGRQAYHLVQRVMVEVITGVDME